MNSTRGQTRFLTCVARVTCLVYYTLTSRNDNAMMIDGALSADNLQKNVLANIVKTHAYMGARKSTNRPRLVAL